MLLYFRDKIGQSNQPSFSKGELSMLLGIYGDRVKRGEWRDYAIDSLPDMAVFSVFRSSQESPLFSIAKIPSRSILKPSQFAIYSGKDTIRQGSSLSDVLDYFREQA